MKKKSEIIKLYIILDFLEKNMYNPSGEINKSFHTQHLKIYSILKTHYKAFRNKPKYYQNIFDCIEFLRWRIHRKFSSPDNNPNHGAYTSYYKDRFQSLYLNCN